MVISPLCIRFVALFTIFCAYTSLVHAASAGRPKNRIRVPNAAAAASGNDTESTVGSQDECPESDGFFPHPQQCDKYVECRDGSIYTEKLCPDGLVFNALSAPQEKCDLPFNIDCSQRTKLQEPKPTDHCPRLNGYFSHEESNVCNKFYYCVDGKFNLITCPDGLVYNEKTGICSWPDEAKKKGCTSQDLFKFTCPKVDVNFAAQHPRYADPEDCQFFYVCINGEVPRRSGCKLGQVFNDKSGSCDSPKNVAECVDWYKGVLTDEELAAIEQEAKPKPKPKPTKAQSHHRGNAGRRREKIETNVDVSAITSSEESPSVIE